MQSSFQNTISLRANHLFLHQQDSFTDEASLKELKKHPLHVYLICRSPSIKLDPTKTTITKEDLYLQFYTAFDEKRKYQPIKTNNRISAISKIECKYPYKIVEAFRDDNSLYTHSKAGLLLKELSRQNGSYLDEFNLEVLYVGQALGKDGKRITVDRLKSHEKAQAIYFQTQEKYPDYEVWFVSISFEPILVTMLKPWGNVDPDNFENELKHQEKIETTPVSFDQQITAAEAALIKYFNTSEYNKEYLNFPSREHTSYDELYSLDFNSVAVELSSRSLHTKLWSQSVAPKLEHIPTFFLHSDTDRKSMFKWYE